MNNAARIALTLAAFAATGCTSEQIYNSTSELRAQQCANAPITEQTSCTSGARTSYSEYKKARDESVGSK